MVFGRLPGLCFCAQRHGLRHFSLSLRHHQWHRAEGHWRFASAKPSVARAGTAALTSTSVSEEPSLAHSGVNNGHMAVRHSRNIQEQAAYRRTSSICSEIQTPNCGEAFYYRLSCPISTLRQSWLSPKSWYSFQICWLGLNLRWHHVNHENSPGETYETLGLFYYFENYITCFMLSYYSFPEGSSSLFYWFLFWPIHSTGRLCVSRRVKAPSLSRFTSFSGGVLKCTITFTLEGPWTSFFFHSTSAV